MNNYQKLKSIRRFFIIVSIIFISAASLSAQTKKAGDWAGVYTFFDTPCGSSSKARSADSYALTPGVEYSLTVARKGDGFSATLEINGMQQFEVYNCSAKTSGKDKLDILYPAKTKWQVESILSKIEDTFQ